MNALKSLKCRSCDWCSCCVDVGKSYEGESKCTLSFLSAF